MARNFLIFRARISHRQNCLALSTQAVRTQHTTATETPRSRGLLEGIKVLDLTRVLAGPFCSQILADYGAEVTKVEHPVGGDDTRLWRTEGEDRMWRPGTKGLSVYFASINRNKKSISLDLKSQKGRNILLRLAQQADVVIDNFVPGKMDELGIGYARLKEINPRIIHASVSGYGASGPAVKRAGYDMIVGAEAGLLHITGEPEGKPSRPGLGLTDMCTGLYLHGAILAALVSRHSTGKGQKIDASLFETQVSLLSNVGMTWLNLNQEAKRWGSEHPSIAPYGAFETKDRYIVIGASCPMSQDSAPTTERVKNRAELKSVLNNVFIRKTTDEWLTLLEGSGMPYGAINNMEQVFAHPQTTARHMVKSMKYDATASGELKLLGIPVKFSEQEPTIRLTPPVLGQHTEEVLGKLGYTPEDTEGLRKEGIV